METRKSKLSNTHAQLYAPGTNVQSYIVMEIQSLQFGQALRKVWAEWELCIVS